MVASLRAEWNAPPAVHGLCTLRAGGVSAAPFDSLNLGAHVGDDARAVAENRRRVRESLRLPGEPLWLEQVHGAVVCDADASAPGQAPPRADAAVTRRAGRVLAIMVADCMPVLLASAGGEVLGAAHAGWRGLAGGVLEATVAAMGVDARGLSAWLGPAIGQAHFEVGEDVRSAFVAHDAAAAAAFAPNPRGRWQCDLAMLARARLAALGVARIADCGVDTHGDPERCFSHRRDGRGGRMAALLWRDRMADAPC